MRILIAEDSPIVQLAHRLAMESWGFEYDIANNGEEAFELARRYCGCFDLGIFDVTMPVMDGIDATERIRSEVGYFPILGHSTDPDEKIRCLKAGMDEFEVKPCSSARMLQIIETLTAKVVLIHINDAQVSVLRGMPMNADELKDLQELKKKGLTKLKLLGLERTFVVHRNIQNKISHDLVGAGKEISEFIDRSPDEPGRCHLYKANLYVTKELLLPEELEDAIRQEDEVAIRFEHIADSRGDYEI